MDDGYYRVPVSSIVEKLDRIDENTTKLLTRDEQKTNTLNDHEKRLRVLSRWVYGLGIPTGALGAVGLGAEIIGRL